MENKKPFIICLMGGIMLIVAGATGGLGFIELIANILANIPALQDFIWILTIVMYVLLILVNLGGITVIGGALLLTRGKTGTGKFIIGLGAGMGLIGLVIGLIQMFIVAGGGAVLGFVLLASQSIGWVGGIVTIIGRRTAK